MTESDYREYLAAFNRQDFEGCGRFYARDVIFEGRGGNFRGRDQVLKFYRRLQSRLSETLVTLDLIVAPEGIVADLLTRLQPLEDWPDFATRPLRKGETVLSQNFVWYEIEDDRFTRIRSAHYRYLS